MRPPQTMLFWLSCDAPPERILESLTGTMLGHSLFLLPFQYQALGWVFGRATFLMQLPLLDLNFSGARDPLAGGNSRYCVTVAAGNCCAMLRDNMALVSGSSGTTKM